MKAIWKFPALVRGTPPNSKEERFCLVAGTCEIEIEQLNLADMPLAMTAEIHHMKEKQEYRLHDGHLWERIDFDPDVFVMENECADVMSYGYSYVYKDIAEEILDIMTSGTENAWPKNAHLHRSGGARELAKSGVKMSADGESDLRFWEDRFRRGMNRFALAGGLPWRRISEPVWCLNLDRRQLILDEASCFTAKRVDDGRKNPANDRTGAKYRMFSVTDFTSVESMISDITAQGPGIEKYDQVEIVMPEVFTLDVDRLELDRMARVTVAHVANVMAMVKPGGGETFLEVAPSSVTTSWMALRDLVKSYDPLDGVPDELEDIFADFVDQARLMMGIYGEAFVPAPLWDAFEYAFSRWDNRRVALAPIAALPMGM